jgi:hypothetical protein
MARIKFVSKHDEQFFFEALGTVDKMKLAVKHAPLDQGRPSWLLLFYTANNDALAIGTFCHYSIHFYKSILSSAEMTGGPLTELVYFYKI